MPILSVTGTLFALAAPVGSVEAGAKPLTVAMAIGLVGLVPLLFMSLTAFVKISTVLHITRSALGAPEVPSGPIVLALAVALTLVAMAPVGTRIADRIMPLLDSMDRRETGAWVHDVVTAVRDPMTDFLRSNTSPRHLRRFAEIVSKKGGATGPDDLRVLIPAFLVSELMQAFVLGFAIYLPFLVVDLVVANVLTALGLVGLSSDRVSLPLKLLLFVAADGWGTLAQTLVSGYKT